MICKFCGKYIYETETSIGANGMLIHMRGKYRHIDGDYLHCKGENILPNTPLAQCHICKTTTYKHDWFCSAAGKPRYFPEL